MYSYVLKASAPDPPPPNQELISYLDNAIHFFNYPFC